MPNSNQQESDTDQPVRTVTACRLSTQATRPQTEDCSVAVEQAITIEIQGHGSYVLMSSPFELDALAVGFARSEGLIDDRNDIEQITVEAHGPWSSLVRIKLAADPRRAVSRTMIIGSSCGICGSRNIEDGLTGPAVGNTLQTVSGQLITLSQAMRQRQALFARTGGSHAAAVFSADGEIVTFAEDVGRHSALDKAIGKCLLADLATRGCGVMLSGRVSFEMVGKAALAGIEVIAAVSAPLSLAVETASQRNITLCCFVRDDRVTVYTHPNRITDCQQNI